VCLSLSVFVGLSVLPVCLSVWDAFDMIYCDVSEGVRVCLTPYASDAKMCEVCIYLCIYTCTYMHLHTCQHTHTHTCIYTCNTHTQATHVTPCADEVHMSRQSKRAEQNAIVSESVYGVATISSLLKMIGPSCKRALSKR